MDKERVRNYINDEDNELCCFCSLDGEYKAETEPLCSNITEYFIDNFIDEEAISEYLTNLERRCEE